MKMTGSDIFVEVLIEQGVETIFGYPGGAVLNLYDALYKNQHRINHVMTAHEQGAAHAADGYARATGKVGVCLATSGPGATNLVTGIATAYMDSIPMVAFTGNVATSGLGKDSFQEVYIAGITMPITKHNFVVDRVEDLADVMRQAFEIAQTGRKGPVLVDIPKDVSAALCEYIPAEPAKDMFETELDEETLDRVAELINQAERPVVYFGGGVVASEAGNELRELINKAEIPATYTIMAAGVLGYKEPLNLGMIGMHGLLTTNMAIDNADLVLAIGTRFSDRVALNPGKFAKKAKVVHIDIDMSEVHKNVRADEYMIGQVKDILAALLPKVEARRHPRWMEQIAAWQAEDYVPTDSDTTLKPHQIIDMICDKAGEDAIYVTDVGQHQMWAAQFIHHVGSRNFLTSGGLGTMGYGYGAALGAQVACPDKPVIHITGDGSFHMNMNEACTAVSYELPVITVIFNNAVLGMVRQWQTAFYGKRYSSTDPHRKTDYVKVVEGFGGTGFRCTNLDELSAALDEAMKRTGPVWIDCVMDKDEKVLPMIPPGATVDVIVMK
ncbi:MAG: biosynthetic-type acetolactate synthase large subunit [Lachnospiraceae bacterium]|nr:biosynthetic-type acetolactate synthase large subunit [Lachnospiraceae bacterium]